MRRRVFARMVMLLMYVAVVAAPSALAQHDTSASGRTTVPAYRARVLGVFDETSGAPVEGVRVLDLATGAFANTTTTGTVSLVYLPDGGSLVRLQKVGFEPVTMMVTIAPTQTAPVTITMRRLTELPAVVSNATATSKYLSPQLRGFEARMKAHVDGYFIDDSILRREENRVLVDVLRSHAPQIQIFEGPGGSKLLLRSPSCSEGGPPTVYLDGVPLKAMPVGRGNAARIPSGTPAFDLSHFDVSEFGGIEWYPDNTRLPIEFGGTATGCGALLLWTRER